MRLSLKSCNLTNMVGFQSQYKEKRVTEKYRSEKVKDNKCFSVNKFRQKMLIPSRRGVEYGNCTPAEA